MMVEVGVLFMLINEVLVNIFDHQGRFAMKGSTRRRWLQDKYRKISLDAFPSHGVKPT
jgi:hypothetical protein